MDFERVFADAARIQDRFFTVLYRPSPPGVPGPRLGLAVSKRRVPRAAARNRVKRLARESFRRHRARMGPVDVVLMARPAVTQAENPTLLAALHRAWKRLDHDLT